MANDKQQREHATSTAELVEKLEKTTNPVTQAGYRSMIADRIGLKERQQFVDKQRLLTLQRAMEKLTYSFDSRMRMREIFEQELEKYKDEG